MVRFEMMHHQIVGNASVQGCFQLCQPFLSLAGVHSVEYGCLFVKDQVRIVGDSLRHFVLALKKVYAEVVRYDVDDVCAD